MLALQMATASATTLPYPVVVCLVLLMPPVQPRLPSAGLGVVALFAALSAGAPILDGDLRAWGISRAELESTKESSHGR